MTTQPDTPPQQPSTAWDENRIVDSIQAKSTDEPRIDVYNQVEWVTDDVAIGLAMEVYKDMRAEIAALQAENNMLFDRAAKRLAEIYELRAEIAALRADLATSQEQAQGLIRLNNENAEIGARHMRFGDDAIKISLWGIGAIKAKDERIAELEDALHFAANYKGIEGRSCPLCKYENGVFIERCQMHKDMHALRAQLAESRAGTYRPIEGNITFARNGNLFVMDATSLDGLPFPEGHALCQLQPGSPLGKGGDA